MKRISMSYCKRRLFQAFTRLDLVVVAGSVFLVLALALPALASKARSQQAVCFNNLRQIGRALHIWGNDHGNYFPWQVAPSDGGSRVRTDSGGYYGTNTGTTTWIQFGMLSNELGSPKFLSCPSDDRRVATEFSFNPEKGLFHNNFRDNAISYFICSDANWMLPGMLLAGDRNMQWDDLVSICASVGYPAATIFPGGGNVHWTNNIHFNAGHWLYVDGRVGFLDNTAVAATINTVGDGNGYTHVLTP
jgi:hypothetical protein